MTGRRFGRLLVLGQADLDPPKSNYHTLGWRCRCDCGQEIVRPRWELLSGKVQSCGCLMREANRETIADKVGQYDGTSISAIRPERPANRNSKSGVKGVYWSESEQRWVASIFLRGKCIKLGRFRSLDDAAAARREAEEKYFAPIIEEYESKR